MLETWGGCAEDIPDRLRGSISVPYLKWLRFDRGYYPVGGVSVFIGGPPSEVVQGVIGFLEASGEDLADSVFALVVWGDYQAFKRADVARVDRVKWFEEIYGTRRDDRTEIEQELGSFDTCAGDQEAVGPSVAVRRSLRYVGPDGGTDICVWGVDEAWYESGESGRQRCVIRDLLAPSSCHDCGFWFGYPGGSLVRFHILHVVVKGVAFRPVSVLWGFGDNEAIR